MGRAEPITNGTASVNPGLHIAAKQTSSALYVRADRVMAQCGIESL